MNIATLRGLDTGISQLKFAGRVGYVGPVREHQGRNGGVFYTQFVTVEDDTGGIGVDLRLGDSREKALTMADKGARIECWGGTVRRYTDKQGKEQVAMRAFGEVQSPRRDPAPDTARTAETAGRNPVTGGRQWVPDREKDHYILVENINTAVSLIAVAAVEHAGYKPGQLPEMIKAIGQCFLEMDLDLLSRLRGAQPTATPAGSGPGPEEPQDDKYGFDPDEVPF